MKPGFLRAKSKKLVCSPSKSCRDGIGMPVIGAESSKISGSMLLVGLGVEHQRVVVLDGRFHHKEIPHEPHLAFRVLRRSDLPATVYATITSIVVVNRRGC